MNHSVLLDQTPIQLPLVTNCLRKLKIVKKNKTRRTNDEESLLTSNLSQLSKAGRLESIIRMKSKTVL